MLPAILVFAASVGANSAPVPGLFGSVYESTTNTPVATATVVVTDANGVELAKVNTDKDGEYTLQFAWSAIGPLVVVTVDGPGFSLFRMSMPLSQGWRHQDFYIKPKMICTPDSDAEANIGCMTQSDATNLARRFGSPFLEGWATTALEELSDRHGADGERKLLLLNSVGNVLGVATPVLQQSAQSFSAGEGEPASFEVYRYTAIIDSLAPLNETTSAQEGSSISTNGCPSGGGWEQNQVYGSDNNPFGCTYWASRGAVALRAQ